MVSKKFREASISFGNTVIMDRNGLKSSNGKSQTGMGEETIGDKNPDPMNVDQYFKIYCEEERNKITEE